MPECPVCACEMTLDEDAIKGELIECHECGSELEVTSIDPQELAEAPTEDEDWGE